MKIKITKPDGTVIEAEGTPDEIAAAGVLAAPQPVEMRIPEQLERRVPSYTDTPFPYIPPQQTTAPQPLFSPPYWWGPVCTSVETELF